MIRDFFLIPLVLLGLLSPATIENWLQPSRFRLQKGETVYLHFQTVNEDKGMLTPDSLSPNDHLTLYYSGFQDALDHLLEGRTVQDSITMQFFDEGTAMFTFLSQNRWRLPDSSFTGQPLLPETDAPSGIWFQDVHKTILQVGGKTEQICTRETGIPFDIIPEKNPYQLKAGQALTLRCLLRGKPLSGVQVDGWYRSPASVDKSQWLTDSLGRITLPLKGKGDWIIRAIHLQRHSSGDSLAWQGYRTTLTWGD